jgi:putative spermidine/putrescine transport system permease protein
MIAARARPSRLPWHLLTVGVVLIYGFIFVPIVITAAVSFNATSRSVFPPQGFSLRWWSAALTEQWIGPLVFSLELAALSALCTVVLGTPLAFALHRYRFYGRNLVNTLVMGPLVLPALITGIALLQFLYLIGLGDSVGFWALLIGYITICLPFGVRTVGISLKGMPTNLEHAAMNLGATRFATLRDVTLPMIRSGIFAGGTFAFIHAFTDVSLSLFVGSPGERPITVEILNSLEFGFEPTLAALSVITLLIPLALVWLLQRWMGIGDFIYGDHAGE